MTIIKAPTHGSISIPWVEGPMPSTDAARSELERCGYTNICTFQHSEHMERLTGSSVEMRDFKFFVVVSGEKAS